MITPDLNPLNYRLHILMNSISDALDFQIDQSIAEHLQSALEANNDTTRFFCFSCKDGTRIALSIDDICLAHYLWETGFYIDNKSESEAKIELHFRDRSEPYSACIEDYDEIDVLFEELASTSDEHWLSFTDCDDELVVFRTQQVVLVVASPYLE